MKHCSCTLSYADPNACKTCNNGWGIPSDIWDGWNQWVTKPLNYTLTTSPINGIHYLYNPETHELVEKKEAKIKRLEAELQRWNDDVEIFDEMITESFKEKKEALKIIDEINKELKQLK